MREDKSFAGLLLSLLFHAALAFFLIMMPKPKEQVQQAPTEVTILDSKDKKNFVTESGTPERDLLEELKTRAEYLSELNKRVKEQTRAKSAARTQNTDLAIPNNDNKAQGYGSKEKFGSAKGGGQVAAQDIQSSLAGLQPKPKEAGGPGAGRQEGLGKNLVMGSSSLSEFVPGVKEGAFTALNTDQFTYYTYFARINEGISYRWVTMVRNYLGGLSDKDLNQLAAYQRNFQVEVVLSSEGQYLKAFIHHSSGDHALDMTSIDAFQAAAPFLNPPKGLVEDDGFIHLHYNFIVSFRPRTGMGG